MIAHVGIDLGPRHGAVALAWPSTCARPPFVVVACGWSCVAEVAAARAWLNRVIPALPYPLAPRWAVELAFVTRRAPQAGAHQLRSAVEWAHEAGGHKATLVEVPSGEWRARYGIPQGPGACRASRAWVALLYPGLALGKRDHVSDAVLVTLAEIPGGAEWARATLAAATGEAAAAVMMACADRRRRKRASKPGTADVATIPVVAYLERRAAAGDSRAVRALAEVRGRCA